MIEDDYKCLVMAAEDPFSPAENPDRYPFVVVPGLQLLIWISTHSSVVCLHFN